VLTGFAGCVTALAAGDGALSKSGVARDPGIIVWPLNGLAKAGGGVGDEVILLRIEIAGDGRSGSPGLGDVAGCDAGCGAAMGAGGGVCAGGTEGRMEIVGRGGNGAAWLGVEGAGAAGGGVAAIVLRIGIDGLAAKRGGSAAGLATKSGGSDSGFATNIGGSSAMGWAAGAGRAAGAENGAGRAAGMGCAAGAGRGAGAGLGVNCPTGAG
jgi:hypothetical protein